VFSCFDFKCLLFCGSRHWSVPKSYIDLQNFTLLPRDEPIAQFNAKGSNNHFEILLVRGGYQQLAMPKMEHEDSCQQHLCVSSESV